MDQWGIQNEQILELIYTHTHAHLYVNCTYKIIRGKNVQIGSELVLYCRISYHTSLPLRVVKTQTKYKY